MNSSDSRKDEESHFFLRRKWRAKGHAANAYKRSILIRITKSLYGTAYVASPPALKFRYFAEAAAGRVVGRGFGQEARQGGGCAIE